jgi:hypothetical protein
VSDTVVAIVELASLLEEYAAESPIASINVTAATIVQSCIRENGASHACIYLSSAARASCLKYLLTCRYLSLFHLLLDRVPVMP